MNWVYAFALLGVITFGFVAFMFFNALFVETKQMLMEYYNNMPKQKARTREKYEVGDMIWRPMHENNVSWYAPGIILTLTQKGRWSQVAEIEYELQDKSKVKESIDVDLLRRRKEDPELNWIKDYVKFRSDKKENMTDTQRLDMLKMLYDNAFYIQFNMNDTWGWATADCGSIDIDDLPVVYELYKKYGDEAIVAYVAIDEGGEPMPEWMKLYGEPYKKAKEELLKLQAEKKILV